MKNSVKNRGDVDRTVRVVWWWFQNMQRTALLVKITRAGAHLVWFDSGRGVRFSIEPMPTKPFQVVDASPRKAIASYRKIGKDRAISKQATAALKEAYGAL